MKETILKLNETIKETQLKYLMKEDITVPLSELVVLSNNLIKAYEEYEKSPSKKPIAERKVIKNREAVNKVAYFLSRYEHYAISNEKRPTPAIRKIAEKLDIKYSSLRGKRDSFDYFVKKEKRKDKEHPELIIRNGWKTENLSKELQVIYDECKGKSYEKLLGEVEEILKL